MSQKHMALMNLKRARWSSEQRAETLQEIAVGDFSQPIALSSCQPQNGAGKWISRETVKEE